MTEPTFSNRDVAQALRDVADLMRLKGENRFRIAAIDKAAGNIQDLEVGLKDIVDSGKLETIEGIGKGIANEIRSLFDLGEMEAFSALSMEYPIGLLDILRLPNIGPRKALTLWQELGVTSLTELEQVAKSSKVREVKGFTKKSEATLLASIEYELCKPPEGDPIGLVLPAVEGLIELLKASDPNLVEEALPTGELRRWQETIDRAQILAASRNGTGLLRLLQGLPTVSGAYWADEGHVIQADLHVGIQVAVTVCDFEDWAWQLVQTTGDGEFLDQLKRHGGKNGFEAGQRGWAAKAEVSGRAVEIITSEAEVFHQIGLSFVVPEQRTSWATPNLKCPRDTSDLVTATSLMGELHAHSTYSDGSNTLSEMARAAMERNYNYWAATDHGLGHGFGDSLDGAALRAQAIEIDLLNNNFASEGVDFRLLKGIEAEILADGSLGLDEDTLARLDVVVASIHSSLRQDSETITNRCLKAIQSPHVDILGHPSSRLLGRRSPTALDVHKVLQVCAETGTAVEINCNPARLDLNEVYARHAADLGCQLVLNCDAHGINDLEVLRFGIGVARRAGLSPQNVLNTRSLAEVLEFFKTT